MNGGEASGSGLGSKDREEGIKKTKRDEAGAIEPSTEPEQRAKEDEGMGGEEAQGSRRKEQTNPRGSELS